MERGPASYCCGVEDLLKQLAQTRGGSDLILTVGRPPMLRIYGNVVPVEGHPDLTPEQTEELGCSLLTEERSRRFDREKEIDLSYDMGPTGRFRINLFHQRGHIGLVARLVTDQVPCFEALGLPPVITELAKLKRGLLLFTGPTGQGKSTSVASVVDYINHHRPCHIVTIEDPIEYLHRHQQATIEQREVGVDTESFHAALRRVLRQAPDVIVIGEIRDCESAQAAITLAETGHLILATLHTSGAMATVNRLIDMFPPEQSRQIRTQLSASLAAVIWQQLIPAKEKDSLVLACEVLVAIPAVRALIRQGRVHEIVSLLQTGRKFGMFTMDQSIDELIKQDRVDLEWFNNNYFDIRQRKKKP